MKLPWLAERVVIACHELTAAQKLLWMQYRALDQGEAGAYIGEVAMAVRIGMGCDNVKKLRAALVSAGLLVSERRQGRRTASWFLVWPDEVGLPTSGRVDVAEIGRLAHELDGAIRVRRADDDTSGNRGTRVPPSDDGPDGRRGYGRTPIERKGGTAVPPTGVRAYTPTGVRAYPQSSKKRLGAEVAGEGSVVPDEVLPSPTSAAPLAPLGRRSGERSDERQSDRTAGPEHVGAIIRRAG